MGTGTGGHRPPQTPGPVPRARPAPRRRAARSPGRRRREKAGPCRAMCPPAEAARPGRAGPGIGGTKRPAGPGGRGGAGTDLGVSVAQGHGGCRAAAPAPTGGKRPRGGEGEERAAQSGRRDELMPPGCASAAGRRSRRGPAPLRRKGRSAGPGPAGSGLRARDLRVCACAPEPRAAALRFPSAQPGCGTATRARLASNEGRNGPFRTP